jgi:lipopolysaccharide/colanic/teichoic acid biosynthesis glycosyltransferase
MFSVIQGRLANTPPQGTGGGGLRIAVFAEGSYKDVEQELASSFQLTLLPTLQQFEQYLFNLPLYSLPEVILIEIDREGKCFDVINRIHSNPLLKGIIIIVVGKQDDHVYINEVRRARVHDFYLAPVNYQHLVERIQFLVKFKLIKPRIEELSEEVVTDYRMPFAKRMFDILFSGILLLLLSPLFIVVAILVKLDSRGPVFYKSKRVGTGYKIFDFYKFRSMRKDADAQLAKLAALNQYSAEAGKSAFMKIKNDPRISRVGAFLRRTSIDELPQLFNIFKGDMSAVGNRPLPLYEAEMLTSNEWALRFLAPAGLTGLWQVSKRGKEDMSERERKKLDNFYAQKYSFWFDIKILLKTVPALFQKENV